MPRTRPLRTKEEIDAVPADKSVTISLGPEEEPVIKDDDLQEEPAVKTKTKKETPVEDDQTIDLKKQLEDLRHAKEESDRRIQEEIKARQEAEKVARDREQEVSRSQIRAEDAEYDAILNAIGAAETEADSAQRDLATANEAGDHKAAAEANRRMARAEGRLVQLNDGKDAIERAKTQAIQRSKEEKDRPTNRPAPTVEQYIDSLPNLLQSQKDWLRKHPDSLSDPRKNMRLQGAHVEAEDQGFRPGTTEYFEYLDDRLGYKERTVQDDDNDDRPVVSAPPSRQATNPGTGRPSNTKITLTPEQREIAKLSGIDEITYARQLQKLQQLKSDGHYGSN